VGKLETNRGEEGSGFLCGRGVYVPTYLWRGGSAVVENGVDFKTLANEKRSGKVATIGEGHVKANK